MIPLRMSFKFMSTALTLLCTLGFHVSPALASEYHCVQSFIHYHERNQLLKELLENHEMTDSEFESRLEDSRQTLEAVTPVNCRGVSRTRMLEIYAHSYAEVLDHSPAGNL
jgi:hypothetical protein